MISIEELEKYNFPNPIDFNTEENRLRSKNMQQLQNFLSNLIKCPEMINDYELLKPKEFTRKYALITNNEDIYIDCKNFILKITNYADNFDLSRNYLIKKLQEDQALASNFIIDFKKQNPYEKIVEKYFKYLETDIKLINNFKHLPVSGPTAKYVYNGLIQDDKIKNHVQETPPSVDFIWDYSFNDKSMHFYASHKYTHGEGTAQKNQMRDLETFLDHSLKSVTNNNYFIAIMDGNYYTDSIYPNYNASPKPKVIEHIKSMRENEKCKVATSFTLIDTIIDLIEKFLKSNFDYDSVKDELKKLEILKVLHN